MSCFRNIFAVMLAKVILGEYAAADDRLRKDDCTYAMHACTK